MSNDIFKVHEAILSKEGVFVDLAEDGFHLLNHDGTYCRMVGFAEAEDIRRLGKQIYIRDGLSFQIASKWKHIFTTTDVDDSDFYAPLSSSGGKYSFKDRYNYYGRNNAGTIEFLCLSTTESSCGSTQTWEGIYVDKTSVVTLVDTDPTISLVVAAYDSENKDDSIMNYGILCSVNALFRSNSYTSSKWDPNTGNYVGGPKTTEYHLTHDEQGELWAVITSTTGMSLPKSVSHRVREAYEKALSTIVLNMTVSLSDED